MYYDAIHMTDAKPPCFVISFFSMLSRASNSLEHRQYLQSMWEICKVGTKVMVMFRDGKRWKKYKATITFRPIGITSKYKVKFEGEGDRIWNVKMLSIYENQETYGIVSVGWEEDEEDEEDAIDEEEEDEEEEEEDAIDPEEEDEEEEEEDAIDKGQQIGDFWSRVVYKVRFGKHQLNGRVIETNGDEYFVRQCNVGNLEFKGKAWSLKARDIKTKNK